MSIRESYIELLSTNGYKQDTTYKTRKYIVFIDKNNNTKRIFLGSHSAVRYGSTIGNSYATTIKQFIY